MLKSLLKGFGQSMAVVATISVLTAGAAVAADSPFKSLAGRWVGGGSIKFKTGEAEKINCRVTYFVSNGGNSVSQNIRCASATYKFDVRSSFNYSGGKVNGSWAELTNDASGVLAGRANGSTINVAITGNKLNGSMSVSLNGASQSVNISPSNAAITRVSINLKKG